MREDQINAARVDVERLAQIFHGHRGALDVPAGTPAPELRVPRGLVRRLRPFPESEIARVLLLILVRIDALARAGDVAREIYLRELAVFGKRADAVIDRNRRSDRHGPLLRAVR